jgi:hypothetical protein
MTRLAVEIFTDRTDQAQPHPELFHDASGEVYATVPVGAHHETFPLQSRGMRRWMTRAFYLAYRMPPDQNTVREVLLTMEAQALFDGPVRSVHLRLAQTAPDCIWLDLGDDSHQAAQITKDAWWLVADPPVKFRRRTGMQALPTPAHTDGTLDDLLRPLLNLPGDRDWALVLAWLLACFRADGPFPVLLFRGEQGSGKSVAVRLLRRVVDPSKVDLDAEPRELRDIAIAAGNSWLLAYDNISHLPQWLSDALCRLATGGGFRTRQLYENDEEMLFSHKRPVVLTGVDDVVTSSDLLDRLITVSPPVIPVTERRTEAAIWDEFDGVAPLILGSILGALSGTLAALPRITDRAVDLPRMADFALWSLASEYALDRPPGTFLDAYAHSRQDAHAVALEASPIAAALLAWLAERPATGDPPRREWRGIASELLAELDGYVTRLEGVEATRRKGWPRSGRGMAGCVERIRPNLRHLGIHITYQRTTAARRYTLIDTRDLSAKG